MEEILKLLKTLPKEYLQVIILELMKDQKISYEDITKSYVEYLDMLRKGQSEAYQELQYKVVELWSGTKKDRDQKLKDIMHYLLDKGRINTTHEDIDKHKWEYDKRRTYKETFGISIECRNMCWHAP